MGEFKLFSLAVEPVNRTITLRYAPKEPLGVIILLLHLSVVKLLLQGAANSTLFHFPFFAAPLV